MTENEAAILTALMPPDGAAPALHTLKQIGGKKGSHHSVTARRMAEAGWVRREQRGGGEHRPAWAYMIIDRGRQALANHLATKGRKP